MVQSSWYQNFLWACWFLGKKLAFQDPPSLKCHNRTDILSYKYYLYDKISPAIWECQLSNFKFWILCSKFWISNFEFLILHFFCLYSYFLSFWLSLVDIKLLILRRNLNMMHLWKCLSTQIWNDPIVHGCFKFLCSMIQPWDDYQTHLFSEDFEQKRRWNLA